MGVEFYFVLGMGQEVVINEGGLKGRDRWQDERDGCTGEDDSLGR